MPDEQSEPPKGQRPDGLDGTRQPASQPEEPSAPFPNVFPMAVLLEGGMGLLALGLGWLLSSRLAESIHWGLTEAVWGLAATLPLVALLLVCVHVPVGVLRRLLQTIDRNVVPLFRSWGLVEMAMVSALAGLGEEMLFRGVIQQAAGNWVGAGYGDWVGWMLASVLFGLVHAISMTYAVLAAGIGLYLGALWMATGNLMVPIIAHAVYDFLALVYLVRIRGRT